MKSSSRLGRISVACWRNSASANWPWRPSKEHLPFTANIPMRITIWRELFDELGRRAEADLHWRAFLELAPESPWGANARHRLGGGPV